MVHQEAIDFMIFAKKCYPSYFRKKRVLDVGSGDINGNNQHLFYKCNYTGNDVYEAPNVTVVSRTKDLKFKKNTFDTIVSTECFEHDPEYELSLKKIYEMLKPNGLFVFTCASIGRPEHGTRKSDPLSSWGTISMVEDMRDYYKNLSEQDLYKIFDMNKCFNSFDTYYNKKSCDLYFIGFKGTDKINIPEYIEENTMKTTRLKIEYITE